MLSALPGGPAIYGGGRGGRALGGGGGASMKRKVPASLGSTFVGKRPAFVGKGGKEGGKRASFVGQTPGGKRPKNAKGIKQEAGSAVKAKTGWDQWNQQDRATQLAAGMEDGVTFTIRTCLDGRYYTDPSWNLPADEPKRKDLVHALSADTCRRRMRVVHFSKAAGAKVAALEKLVPPAPAPVPSSALPSPLPFRGPVRHTLE
jgi:hypothetical protein